MTLQLPCPALTLAILLQLVVFNETGFVTTDTLGAGDVGYAPKGMGHSLRNTQDTEAWLVLIFDDGLFTNVRSMVLAL